METQIETPPVRPAAGDRGAKPNRFLEPTINSPASLQTTSAKLGRIADRILADAGQESTAFVLRCDVGQGGE